MSVTKIISWVNSDIFNLHLVPTNLPVETANEVVEIIITVAQHIQQTAGENSHLRKIHCSKSAQILGIKLRGQKHFAPLCLIYLSHQHETCFMSPFWHPKL
jgi:hypothetical protein